MTERKPPFVTFETWVDKQIREATERGEFDDLPGTGKPLQGANEPYEELWWVKQKMREEGLAVEAALPTPLQLRKEIERLPDTVRELPSERSVRAVVESLNLRIVDWMRSPSGPRVRIRPVNADRVVRQWRAARETAEPVVPSPAPVPDPNARQSRKAPWWRARTR